LVLAALAVGFLVVMARSGHVRESGQFVRFAAAGVMPVPPAQIDRVELATASRRWVFKRAAGTWRMEPEARPVTGTLASRLDDSVKFMHVSAPVRVLEPAEWAPQGLREFGLEPPAYSASLFEDGRRVLAVSFGSPNPQQVLQYMRVEGREQIFVMSRFVGQEWEHVVTEATR
jgi:hypothetical protein